MLRKRSIYEDSESVPDPIGTQPRSNAGTTRCIETEEFNLGNADLLALNYESAINHLEKAPNHVDALVS